ILSRYLAEEVGANVVVTTSADPELRRSNFNGLRDRVTVVQADAADEAGMRRVTENVRCQFGSIDGVLHLAGVTGRDAFQLGEDLSEADIDRVCRAKAGGAEVLARLFRDGGCGFVVLFSSTASVLG